MKILETRNLAWLFIALLIAGCSSSSTNSSGGLELAGNWRGTISTTATANSRSPLNRNALINPIVSQTFQMTLRDVIIPADDEDEDDVAILDGTFTFTNSVLECFTGGGIVQGTKAGSRVTFAFRDIANPPRFVYSLTGNASSSRISGTWAAVDGFTITVTNTDGTTTTQDIVACDLLGGTWVANRI